jgi:hypothetical protein
LRLFGGEWVNENRKTQHKHKSNEKMKVILKRIDTSDHGTIGVLSAGDFASYTIEPPWRDNLPNQSCIPEGEYHCVWHHSPRYGWVYLVADVPGRSHILIHPGNLGGDREKGFHTHTLGCVLLGMKRGQLVVDGIRQEAVLVSRPACRNFFEHMEQIPFQLEVRS